VQAIRRKISLRIDLVGRDYDAGAVTDVMFITVRYPVPRRLWDERDTELIIIELH
jgi:hypothetical protein